MRARPARRATGRGGGAAPDRDARARAAVAHRTRRRGGDEPPITSLRTFRAVVGMTPHQYILHTRLARAAVRLRRTLDGISEIAFAAGFNDLSTFNRRFQRIMGQSPGAYRASALR